MFFEIEFIFLQKDDITIRFRILLLHQMPTGVHTILLECIQQWFLRFRLFGLGIRE